MELDLNVQGDSPQEILAKIAEYLSNAIGSPGSKGLETAAENIPGVTANAGGGGGP